MLSALSGNKKSAKFAKLKKRKRKKKREKKNASISSLKKRRKKQKSKWNARPKLAVTRNTQRVKLRTAASLTSVFKLGFPAPMQGGNAARKIMISRTAKPSGFYHV